MFGSINPYVLINISFWEEFHTVEMIASQPSYPKHNNVPFNLDIDSIAVPLFTDSETTATPRNPMKADAEKVTTE